MAPGLLIEFPGAVEPFYVMVFSERDPKFSLRRGNRKLCCGVD